MIRPKKHLGQHFLNNSLIADKIVKSLDVSNSAKFVLEIGPGTGILTDRLIDKEFELQAIELDSESVVYLQSKYIDKNIKIIEGNFLRLDLETLFNSSFSLIGNFPYNISSQIFFKVIENRELIDEVVCMIQKEVAQRIAEPPGSKKYGILSVFLQAFFDIEYLFTVKPGSFYPPPKVESGVIRLVRNDIQNLDCDEKLFFRVVKQAFQNRRKTLRNALKPINLPSQLLQEPMLDRRAETLGINEFVLLTNKILEGWNK